MYPSGLCVEGLVIILKYYWEIIESVRIGLNGRRSGHWESALGKGLGDPGSFSLSSLLPGNHEVTHSSTAIPNCAALPPHRPQSHAVIDHELKP